MLAIKQQTDSSLSIDQIKAVGKRVMNELIEKAMDNQNIPKDDRREITVEFEKLIRTECPDMLFDSTLVFNENGFHEKK